MPARPWPDLHLPPWQATRDTLHQRIRAIGAAAKLLAEPLPHWWHAALLPGDGELATRPLSGADGVFGVTVDLRDHRVFVEGGGIVPLAIPGERFVAALTAALSAAGAETSLDAARFASPDAYDIEAVARFTTVIGSLSPILASAAVFPGGEPGSVNFWPHHFDLAVSWFYGGPPSQTEPADEDDAPQVTLGFSTGDESIDGPYCYATAHPLPEGLVGTTLPSPAEWHTLGFTGGVLRYDAALATGAPEGAIGAFYRTFLAEASLRMQ